MDTSISVYDTLYARVPVGIAQTSHLSLNDCVIWINVVEYTSMNPEWYSPDTCKLGETDNLPLQQQAAEALFGDVRFRPTAQTVAALIEQGLTEDDILAAGRMKGYDEPIMDETLRDLDVAIPYIQQLSDKIVEDHGGDVIWLAARDFETVADDLIIRYPELEAYLLPASQDLLGHETMYDVTLAARFLGRFGLTAARVADPSKKFAIFDSGFRGSVGLGLNSIARRLHGTSLREADRLTNKLAAINIAEPIVGEQIMDFPGGASNFSKEKLPRAYRIAEGAPATRYSETRVLAVLLQTLPRFHNAYGELAEINGSVVALPSIYEIDQGIPYNPIDNNVDKPDPGRDYGPNDSIVNPVAAAVTMYRVIKSALEQPGVSREAFTNLRNPTPYVYSLSPDMPAPHNAIISPLKVTLRELGSTEHYNEDVPQIIPPKSGKDWFV